MRTVQEAVVELASRCRDFTHLENDPQNTEHHFTDGSRLGSENSSTHGPTSKTHPRAKVCADLETVKSLAHLQHQLSS